MLSKACAKSANLPLGLSTVIANQVTAKHAPYAALFPNCVRCLHRVEPLSFMSLPESLFALLALQHLSYKYRLCY